MTVNECDISSQKDRNKAIKLNTERRLSSGERDKTNPAPASAKKRKEFERRPRHKTRQDRYEPKDGKRSKSKQRRSNQGKRRRSLRKNGRKHSLIEDNFRSSSVMQKRLTVRKPSPVMENGLLKILASSTLITDWAFSRKAKHHHR